MMGSQTVNKNHLDEVKRKKFLYYTDKKPSTNVPYKESQLENQFHNGITKTSKQKKAAAQFILSLGSEFNCVFKKKILLY